MKFPKIEKILRNFLYSDSGSISKSSILKAGVISIISISAVSTPANAACDGHGSADSYWFAAESDHGSAPALSNTGASHCNTGTINPCTWIEDHASVAAVGCDGPTGHLNGDWDHGSSGGGTDVRDFHNNLISMNAVNTPPTSITASHSHSTGSITITQTHCDGYGADDHGSDTC